MSGFVGLAIQRASSSRPLESCCGSIVFDFDGVIADSEPLHLRAFQQALDDLGLALDRDDYFARYLGYDDVGVFEALSRDRALGWTSTRVAELVDLKGEKLRALMHGGEVLFPGALACITAAAAAVPPVEATPIRSWDMVRAVDWEMTRRREAVLAMKTGLPAESRISCTTCGWKSRPPLAIVPMA